MSAPQNINKSKHLNKPDDIESSGVDNIILEPSDNNFDDIDFPKKTENQDHHSANLQSFRAAKYHVKQNSEEKELTKEKVLVSE